MCKNITLILNDNFVLGGYSFKKSKSEIQDINGVKICECNDKKSTQFILNKYINEDHVEVINRKNNTFIIDLTQFNLH